MIGNTGAFRTGGHPDLHRAQARRRGAPGAFVRSRAGPGRDSDFGRAAAHRSEGYRNEGYPNEDYPNEEYPSSEEHPRSGEYPNEAYPSGEE